MNDKQTTRRRILLTALTFSGASMSGVGISLFRSSTAWASSTDASEATATLGRMAQLLFPHEGLDDGIYGSIMSDVLEAAAADAATDAMLSAAEDALNAAQDEDWLELDEVAQLAAMRKLENEPFFAGIRETVRFRLYYHPDLWKHINYPGSSKEHGGYLHRGFNDIAWLPKGD